MGAKEQHRGGVDAAEEGENILLGGLHFVQVPRLKRFLVQPSKRGEYPKRGGRNVRAARILIQLGAAARVSRVAVVPFEVVVNVRGGGGVKGAPHFIELSVAQRA